MKTIGLIGGTTWVSTVDYYKIINQTINKRLGSSNSAKIFLYSLNFEEVKYLIDENNWAELSKLFCSISKRLENAGADCIVLCANTPHKFDYDIRRVINIPLIHIAEETAKEIKNNRIRKVGLLGTKITMEEEFYKNKLLNENIETMIPDTDDRGYINSTIFDEFSKGIFTEITKSKYIEIINKLVNKGAKGIILGCTEIPLIIKQSDCSIPLFDTTQLHAKAAVDFALNSK